MAMMGANKGVSKVLVMKSRSGEGSCSISQISVACLVRERVLRSMQDREGFGVVEVACVWSCVLSVLGVWGVGE